MRILRQPSLMRQNYALQACQFLVLALLGIAIAFLMRFTFSRARAEHYFTPHRHIGSILSPTDAELWCASVADDSISFDEAKDKIRTVLEDSRGWNGLTYIDLYGKGVSFACTDPPSDADITTRRIRMFFKVEDDVTSDCGAGHDGCENVFRPYDDPFSLHSPLPEYTYARIWLKTDNLQNEKEHIVNHEVGHAFNLCDGGPQAPQQPCTQNLGCTGSVMHDYGCDRESWPSALAKRRQTTSPPVLTIVACRADGDGVDTQSRTRAEGATDHALSLCRPRRRGYGRMTLTPIRLDAADEKNTKRPSADISAS